METKNFVVPCDGSTHSTKAAGYAAYLAKATGARLHIINVFPKTAFDLLGLHGASASAGVAGLKPFDEESFNALWEEFAEKAFSVSRAAIGTELEDVTYVKLQGDPASTILDYVRTQTNPAVVMGPRGLGRVAAALLGSVSQAVLHSAKCPIILVSDD